MDGIVVRLLKILSVPRARLLLFLRVAKGYAEPH
jgi:hypothetical protein